MLYWKILPPDIRQSIEFQWGRLIERRSNTVRANVDNVKNYMFVFSCVILVDNSLKTYAQKLNRYLLIYMTMFLIIAVCNYRCIIDVLIIQINRVILILNNFDMETSYFNKSKVVLDHFIQYLRTQQYYILCTFQSRMLRVQLRGRSPKIFRSCLTSPVGKFPILHISSWEAWIRGPIWLVSQMVF